MRAGIKQGHREKLYSAEGGQILGDEEFVDRAIHRMGAVEASTSRSAKAKSKPAMAAVVSAAEEASGREKEEFCGRSKVAALVLVKEAVILIGKQQGASNTELARVLRLEASVVSRRWESARERVRESAEMRRLVRRIERSLEK